MTSNRNAIADYLSYTLISTGENINLRFIDNEIWANLNQISKIYDENENTIKTIVTKIFENDDFIVCIKLEESVSKLNYKEI